MKWSWRLGRIAAIDVYVHVTFLLLLAWVGMQHYFIRRSLADVGNGLIFIIAIFGIVVLHELGHALTARRFGIATRDITLLPIGGIARLERMPEDPKQELLVALAGPAVNVALALLLLLVLGPSQVGGFDRMSTVEGGMLVRLFWINVVLAGFNMLPAFPMDGGRVLRAVLAMYTDYVNATQTAAHIGQALALVFGFFGLFFNPFLVFVALFVWMGASAEAGMVQVKSALGGIPVRRAMITDFQTLSPGETLQKAVEHFLSGFQQDFPVVEDGRLIGILRQPDLMRALALKGLEAPVSEAMEREFQIADPAEMLDTALLRLQNCGCHSLPVLRNGMLLGMLTMENVGELIMFQSAARQAGQRLVPAGRISLP